MPIYLVTVQKSDVDTRIVDAVTKSAAVNHVVRGMVSAVPLSAAEVITHMQADVPVEKAGVKQEEKKVE